ncbi:MAG: tetratricopeptide repeat protein [Myxococcota bacterium]
MNRAWALVSVAFFGCPIVVPDVARQYNDLCAQQLAAGQLVEAETSCDHSLEYQPRYWDALHNKGVIAQQRGDRATAKKRFIEALRANEHMRQSQNSLGAIAVEEGRLSDAEAHFRAALVIEPAYLEARRNLGAVHLQQTRCADAEKDFRQLLLVDARLVEGWLGLGAALTCQDKLELAHEAFVGATELDVGSDAAWLRRGENELVRGLRDDAKDSFERCLLANEKNLECRRALEQLTR